MSTLRATPAKVSIRDKLSKLKLPIGRITGVVIAAAVTSSVESKELPYLPRTPLPLLSGENQQIDHASAYIDSYILGTTYSSAFYSQSTSFYSTDSERLTTLNIMSIDETHYGEQDGTSGIIINKAKTQELITALTDRFGIYAAEHAAFLMLPVVLHENEHVMHARELKKLLGQAFIVQVPEDELLCYSTEAQYTRGFWLDEVATRGLNKLPITSVQRTIKDFTRVADSFDQGSRHFEAMVYKSCTMPPILRGNGQEYRSIAIKLVEEYLAATNPNENTRLYQEFVSSLEVLKNDVKFRIVYNYYRGIVQSFQLRHGESPVPFLPIAETTRTKLDVAP